MLDNKDLQRLNDLSLELEELYKPLRIDEYNAPLNRQQEKEQLLNKHLLGVQYNPQFTYREFPKERLTRLQSFVRKLQPERNEWEDLLYRDVNQNIQTVESVITHDAALITATSIAADGLPSSELVAAARVALSNIQAEPEDETVDAEQSAQIMREALDSIGLNDWEILVDDVMSAAMMVRSVERKVKIRRDKKFSSQSIKRLLVHEIGTHVFRYTNGALQKIHLLRLGLVGYMMTEEGMATFHEEKYGLRDQITARRYALRVIAAYLSLTKSFYDVFTEIVEHTDFDDAFDIVARSKRGFIDTSAFGSHIKDKVYFEGFGRVSAHLGTQPSDYVFLMMGKISLEMLPLLRTESQSGALVEPRYLPELIKLSA